MATDAQIEANRHNAVKSTGPRTKKGKAISGQNAVKHGGYGNQTLAIQTGFFKEDPTEIADYIDSLLEALEPRDALEREEAHRIAMINLRFRRVSRLEADAMSSIDDEPKPRTDVETYFIAGYDSPEHEARLKNRGARIRLAQDMLESVVAAASRIDTHNSRQLEQAWQRYLLLQRRDIPDEKTPTTSLAKTSPPSNAIPT